MGKWLPLVSEPGKIFFAHVILCRVFSIDNEFIYFKKLHNLSLCVRHIGAACININGTALNRKKKILQLKADVQI